MNLFAFAMEVYFSLCLVFILCVFLFCVKIWDNFPSDLFNLANLSVSFVLLDCKSSISNFIMASLYVWFGSIVQRCFNLLYLVLGIRSQIQNYILNKRFVIQP